MLLLKAACCAVDGAEGAAGLCGGDKIRDGLHLPAAGRPILSGRLV